MRPNELRFPVRPVLRVVKLSIFVRVCFAGNLTKHMKSKAHMKKCLELGVSMSSVEDAEADEGGRKHTNSDILLSC